MRKTSIRQQQRQVIAIRAVVSNFFDNLHALLERPVNVGADNFSASYLLLNVIACSIHYFILFESFNRQTVQHNAEY